MGTRSDWENLTPQAGHFLFLDCKLVEMHSSQNMCRHLLMIIFFSFVLQMEQNRSFW